MLGNISLDTYNIFKEVYENKNIAQTDIKILKELSILQKEYVMEFCKTKKINIIFIDGTKDLNYNVEKIYSFIMDDNF